jgi:glutamate-1-semialdehyde 2,1-aminomutase
VFRAPTVDHPLVRELKDAEDARFHAERPRSAELWARAWKVMPNGVPMSWHRGSYHHAPLWVAEGRGARFTDVDGFTYSDFNIADMSMFCGYAPEPVVRAVSDRMTRGNQFLLPTEDSIVVAEELTRRYALPMWQFTLSASQANTEAIRVARVVTGRDKVLLFDGKYHGHFDEALVELAPDGSLRAEERGLPIGGEAHTVVVPFNDPDALADALAGGGIALVLTEPALTNNFGLIMPDDGFHAELRRLTRSTRTLLALDETHTQVVGPGGLTAAWGLEPDLLTAGKSIAAGVPFGAWGMTETIGHVLLQMKGPDGERATWSRPAVPCSATRSRWRRRAPRCSRSSRTRPLRAPRGWARSSRTAWPRPFGLPDSPGTSTISVPGPATRSVPNRSPTRTRRGHAPMTS